MAKAGDSTPPSSWTLWSPDYATSRTTIHRRYLQIPSEQQKLLNRPDAWSTGGIPNVPPRVLEDVRRHHIKQSRSDAEVGRENPSSQPGSPVTATSEAVPRSPDHTSRESLASQPASSPNSTREHSEPTRDFDGAEDSQVEGEPAGTAESWSRSPSAHLRPPCPREEPASAASIVGGSSSEEHDLHTTARAFPRTACLTNFPPSSSAASEMGLEVEVPRAITDVLPPVRPAPVPLLEPTPPSAQIIPCSLTERTSPVRAPKPKRLRLMKSAAPMWADHEPVSMRHPSRLAISNAGIANVSRSSSPVVSSSPPIPEAAPLDPMEMSAVMPSAEDGHVSAVENQSSLLVTTSQLASNEGSSNSVGKLPPNGLPSQVPFTVFKVTYPDYPGSVRDFVRGVMCILQLQKDKELPEFLYDDFIRVFSGDYLRYIDTVGDNQPALRAIHWYNENVSKPLYAKGILTKDNINDVANRYMEDVRAIKQNLRTSKSEARHREARLARDTVRRKTPVAQGPPPRMETLHGFRQNGLPREVASASPGLATTPKAELFSYAAPRTERSPPRRESQGVIAPPESSSNVFGLSSAHQPHAEAGRLGAMEDATETRHGAFRTQIDSSLPVIEALVTPRVTKIPLPVATTLPGATLTQLSNLENIPETAVKRKTAPRDSTGLSAGKRRAAPQEPTGLSAGGPGAEFTRSKKTTKNTAEERAIRFRKFLKQKRTQSSAPGGSTP